MLLPLEFKNQLEVPLVLPKSRVPTLREVSSVTVRLAVMAMVLEVGGDALFPLPSAPPDQLAVVLQLPLALRIQVPLVALAAWESATPENKMRPVNRIFRERDSFINDKPVLWSTAYAGFRNEVGVESG